MIMRILLQNNVCLTEKVSVENKKTVYFLTLKRFVRFIVTASTQPQLKLRVTK